MLNDKDLKKIVIDDQFDGGTGLYFKSKQDYRRMRGEHKLINKFLLSKDTQ